MHSVKLRANGLDFSASSNWPQDRIGQDVPRRVVFFLHGFPDTRATWNSTIEHLDLGDALLIVPAMRGYEPATVLASYKYYQKDIVSDIVSFIETYSLGARTFLVGHDWGAIAAFGVASARPDLVAGAVALAIPYLANVRPFKLALQFPRQLWLSSYMLTMQIPMVYRPLLAEPSPMPYIRKLWEYWSPEWKYSEEELREVCDVLHEPSIADATTAYYRCLFRTLPRPTNWVVDFEKVPFLLLGGRNDGCMAAELFEFQKDKLVDAKVDIIEGVGHFMHREKPEVVGPMISEFINAV